MEIAAMENSVILWGQGTSETVDTLSTGKCVSEGWFQKSGGTSIGLLRVQKRKNCVQGRNSREWSQYL